MANRTHQRPADGSAGASDHTLRGAALALDADRPYEAERMARAALAATPHNAHALHILGAALLMQGRAKEAITPLETAARNRHDPEIETLFAMALRRCGRPGEAASRLKRVCKRGPPYAPAFSELGSVLDALGHHQEAIEALRRGLGVAPMMPQLSIQLGYALLNIRDAANAQRAFARALEISPSSPEALLGMARAERDAGNIQAAADYFRRCAISNPSEYAAWAYLGHCLLELGQLSAGYDCFRTAARRDPRGWGHALSSLVTSRRGRFWLKPSAAQRFFAGAPDSGSP